MTDVLQSLGIVTLGLAMIVHLLATHRRNR